MDEVYSFLSKYINSQLKNYKFSSENKLNNIIDEYYDEYKKYLDKLNNKDDALNETLYSFNKKYLVKKDYKKSTFALLISLFYFIIESLKAFLGLFSFDLSLVFGVIDPILLIISGNSGSVAIICFPSFGTASKASRESVVNLSWLSSDDKYPSIAVKISALRSANLPL